MSDAQGFSNTSNRPRLPLLAAIVLLHVALFYGLIQAFAPDLIDRETAAPELLEAARWMMGELCEAWDESPEKAIPERFRAAIAKATGD